MLYNSVNINFTQKEVRMKLQNTEYIQFILDIKSKIQSSQIKASIKVNVELLKLYWDIAEMIVKKQKVSSWGTGLIDSISKDLKTEYPNMKGFSKRNIELMRQWYTFWSNDTAITKQLVSQSQNEKVQQVVSQVFQVPWGHNILIFTKIKDIKIAKFYIERTIQNNK